MKGYATTELGKTVFDAKTLAQISKRLERCFYVVDKNGKKIRRAY